MSQALQTQLSGKPSYDLSPQATADYFTKAVTQPMMKAFDKEIMPRIRSAYAGHGASMSTRRGDAERSSLEDIGSTLSSQLAQSQMQNMGLSAQLAESALARQAQGIGLTEQFVNAPLTRAGGLLMAGAPYQQQEQMVLDAAYQEYLRTRPESSPYMEYGLAFTGQPHMAIGVTPGSSDSAAWGSLIGSMGKSLATLFAGGG